MPIPGTERIDSHISPDGGTHKRKAVSDLGVEGRQHKHQAIQEIEDAAGSFDGSLPAGLSLNTNGSQSIPATDNLDLHLSPISFDLAVDGQASDDEVFVKLSWPLETQYVGTPNDSANKSKSNLSSRTPHFKLHEPRDTSPHHSEPSRPNEKDMFSKLSGEFRDNRQAVNEHLQETLLQGDHTAGGCLMRNPLKNGCGVYTNRTMNLLLSPQLHPLTALVGEAFVKAWLESVKGHYLLWIHGMQSGDPSLLHSMKHRPDVGGGILVDYDLAIHATSARNRKGTTPFMALELLADRYWLGDFIPRYHHEHEAFIWVLPFVFLRYKDQQPQKRTLVDTWMTSKYTACRLEKNSFASYGQLETVGPEVQADFKNERKLAEILLLWAQDKARDIHRGGTMGRPVVSFYVADVWREYVECLRSIGKNISELGYLGRLVDELGLERIFAPGDDNCMSGIVAGPSARNSTVVT